MSEREKMGEATEIGMGHGKVDVGPIYWQGRTGLLLRPRSTAIPVGEPGALGNKTAPEPYWPVKGDVVIWLDGEEVGQTIINELQRIAAEKDPRA